MTVTTARSDGGIDFRLDLDTDRLLPGRVATGGVHIAFDHAIEVRGIVASLIATETWQHEDTTTDANGQTHTETHTIREELQRLPVMLAGPGAFAAGDARDFKVELPVPPLGPATFEATVSRMDWRVEVKLDVPGMDPDVTAELVVLQPTALLRAGVIDLAPFALYGSANAAGGDASATIALEPVPLCIGEPFRGSVTIAAAPQRLQEIRLELRSKVEATVASGKEEQVTLWTGHVAGEGDFGGGSVTIPFDGVLATPWLPTSRLPHGKADAQFHVILAKAWAQDTHLVRDIAICSTTEL
jgi:hypothetical protein